MDLRMENVQYDGLAAYLGRPSRLHSSPTHRKSAWMAERNRIVRPAIQSHSVSGLKASDRRSVHICIMSVSQFTVWEIRSSQRVLSKDRIRVRVADITLSTSLKPRTSMPISCTLNILAKHTVTSFPSAVPPRSFSAFTHTMYSSRTWMRCGDLVCGSDCVRSRCAKLVSPLRFLSMWVVYFDLSLECHSEKEGRWRVVFASFRFQVDDYVIQTAILIYASGRSSFTNHDPFFLFSPNLMPNFNAQFRHR